MREHAEIDLTFPAVVTTPADVCVRAACTRARALLAEYESCAEGALDLARLEELRTRIDAELRHAGRAASDAARTRSHARRAA